MRGRILACGSVVGLVFLLNGPVCPAADDDTSTGAIPPGDVVTMIAEAWRLALQVAMRRSRDRNALRATIEHETVEATRRFGTVRCSAAPDDEHDPLALLARRRIELEIASLKEQLAITYRSQCITGRLAVTFDVKAIDKPR
ncbi:MAG TPA: hypothetical protein VFS91_05340 [Nitrobacter sp.]|nr:hypothetical protein [Nitrobacter sp.]